LYPQTPEAWHAWRDGARRRCSRRARQARRLGQGNASHALIDRATAADEGAAKHHLALAHLQEKPHKAQRP
jgi:hypothetical protein